MLSIDDIVSDVLRREGGFVDDPDDLGGATNHGVTIHTMKRLGIDLDGDGDVDESDVRALTVAQASEIFKEHYFVKPHISELPRALQPTVFDMYVNAGRAAIKLLQRLVGKIGFPVAVDGMLGPQTLQAVESALAVAPDHLVDAYAIERRNYYYEIGDRRVGSRKFARKQDGGKGGWIRRAEDFMATRYKLTITQHNQRVAAWG